MKSLFNIIAVFSFLLFGPEVMAKSLPMKKVQTVETVWVPMDPGEVEEISEGVEAVEVEPGSGEAVPLFKEGLEAEQQPVQEVVSQDKDLPQIQVKNPQGGQQPVIQVIYQGMPPVRAEKKAVVAKPVKAPVVEKPQLIKKTKKKQKNGKGDIYNFYFSS